MEVLVWIAVGLVVGLSARWIVPGTPAGLVADALASVLGAVAGGWISTLFGRSAANGFDLRSAVCALIGAAVLLRILRAVRRAPAG